MFLQGKEQIKMKRVELRKRWQNYVERTQKAQKEAFAAAGMYEGYGGFPGYSGYPGYTVGGFRKSDNIYGLGPGVSGGRYGSSGSHCGGGLGGLGGGGGGISGGSRRSR